MSWPVAYRTDRARTSGPSGGGRSTPRDDIRGALGGFQMPAAPGATQIPQVPLGEVGNAALAAGARWAVGKLAPRLVPGVSQALLALQLGRLAYDWSQPMLEPQLTRRSGPSPNYRADWRCPQAGVPNTPHLGIKHTQLCVQTITMLIAAYNSAAGAAVNIGGYWWIEYGANLRSIPTGAPTHRGFELAEQYVSIQQGLATPPFVGTGTGWKPWIFVPGRIVLPNPSAEPIADPLAWPQLEPKPTPKTSPKAQPVRIPNPFRAPSETTQTGPQPAPRARPGAAPGTGTQTTFPPVGSGKPPVTTPAPPMRRPPPKKDKEKKLRTGLPPGIVSKIVNAATEGADISDALWDALPKNVRGAGYWQGWSSSAPKRAYWVFVNFSSINWQQAFENLAKNAVEDAALGLGGRLGAKANQNRGRFAPDGQSGVGVQTGGAKWLPSPSPGTSGISW